MPTSLSSPRTERHEDRLQRIVTLASLQNGENAALHDRVLWPDSRLNLWCNHHPLLLLAALPMVPEQVGYPRQKGPPTEADLNALARWHVVMESASDLALWTSLYTWGLDVLFVEYAARHAEQNHPCRERTLWIGSHISRPYLPTLDWGAFWRSHKRPNTRIGRPVVPLRLQDARRAA